MGVFSPCNIPTLVADLRALERKDTLGWDANRSRRTPARVLGRAVQALDRNHTHCFLMPSSTSARIPHPGGRIALWFYLGQIPYLPRGSEVQKEKCTSTPDDAVQKELRKSQGHILPGQGRKSKASSKKIVILFHRKVHGLSVNQNKLKL